MNLKKISINDVGKAFYVYLHFIPGVGYPFNVGKGKNKRALDRKGRSSFWSNVVTKYCSSLPRKFPSIKIVMITKDEERAFCFEQFLIAIIGRRDLQRGPLVNLTNGGEGFSGIIHTKESNEKRSIAMKGFKHTEEQKQRRSDRMKGFKHTPESREKMRVFQNRPDRPPVSKETRAKISAAGKGRIHTSTGTDKMAIAKGSRFMILTHKDGRIIESASKRKLCRNAGMGMRSLNFLLLGVKKEIKGWSIQ